MHSRSRRRRATTAILSTALLSAGFHLIATAAPAGAATTIHVPADQPTMSAALAAAVAGDTIEVAPGTYTEHLDFEGKAVHLVSSAGPETTVIDGTSAELESTIHLGAGGTVEGFSIIDGSANWGGAILVDGDGAVIRHNRFMNNESGYGYFGAAIVLDHGAGTTTVDGNWFSGNTCGGDDQAGASVVFSQSETEPVITNNVFFENPCGDAMRLAGGTGTSAAVVNNTIVKARSGIVVGLPTMIRNNIITEASYGIAPSQAEPSTITNNVLFGNGQNYSGVADQTGTNGNVSADPLFIDRIGADLRVQAGSPTADGGTSTDAPSTDFDGSARPLDGPDADADAEFDIGAYERDGTEPPPVPQTGVLDTGWSGDGLQNQSSRYSIALRPTSDGGTYTGVYRASDGNGPMRISKYSPTGGAAPGWGSSGYVLRTFEPGGHGISFPTHVVPALSRVTVVGEHYRSTARLGVVRMLSDGSYDTTFSGDGRALYKVFPTEHDIVSAFRVDVLTGGKVGIAAIAFDYDSQGRAVFTAQAMLRLNPSGSLDTTFSSDGVAVIPNNWSDIRWRPNGSSFVGIQGSTNHEVRKLLPNGQGDTTFSGDGVITASCGTHRGANMEIDPSGRPLLMCVKPSGSSTTLAIYRITTAGKFDTSYSGDGKKLWNIPGSNGVGYQAMYGFDTFAKPWAFAGGPGATKTMRVYTLDSSGSADPNFRIDGAAVITLPFNVDFNTFARRATDRLFVANFNGDVNVSMVAIKV